MSSAGRPRTCPSSAAPRSERSSRSASSAVERRQPDGDVLERLRIDAAQADQRDRPEPRIAAGADDQLDALAERRHPLDRELRRGEPLLHVARGRLQLAGVGQPDPHAAGVGLVQRAQRLQHDREAELAPGRHHLVDAGRPPRLDERHARRRQQLARPEVAVVQRPRHPAGSAGAPAGGGSSMIAAAAIAAASIVA